MDSGAGLNSGVRVFINYRRADTKHVAGRLRDLIVARFGEESVFVDVESIEPGLDYVAAIDQAVSTCLVMLVLIGEEWLDAVDEAGHRRIDDPADRLRLEIEAGLRHETRVIPVLVDDASMPRTRDLPQDLAPLSRHHAARLRHDSFRTDSAYLISLIERISAGHDPVVRDHRAAADPATGRAVSTSASTAPQVLRWVTTGLLVLVLLLDLGTSSAMAGIVAESRVSLPSSGALPRLVWLLPGLPVLLATLLVARGKAPGTAWGCVAGAAVWVCTSWVFVAWRVPGSGSSEHAILLVLLFAALTTHTVGTPVLRAPVTANRADRAVLSGLLVLAAVLLRSQAGAVASAVVNHQPFAWAQAVPPFWLTVLLPVIIGLPAALLRLNRHQTHTLVTLAWLQVLYPMVLQSMVASSAVGENGLADVVGGDALFLLGSLCVVWAVRAGQHPVRRVAPALADPY